MTELIASEQVAELLGFSPELRTQTTDRDLVALEQQLARSGRRVTTPVPPVLQRFFTGDVDLEVELQKRFATPPTLVQFSARPENPFESDYGTAAMQSQNGLSVLTVDASREDNLVSFGFTLGSMMTLRFLLPPIDDDLRQRWSDLMQTGEGVAFLWGAARWEDDYMIWIAQKYSVHAYAFSAQRFEAAVRLTPDTMQSLLSWLGAYWR